MKLKYFLSTLVLLGLVAALPISAMGDNGSSAAPVASRVTIFSDNFENKSTALNGWMIGRDGTNAAWNSGSPKRGAHSVSFSGSRISPDMFVCSLLRTIPTTGYRNIKVSFYMATRIDDENEKVGISWGDDGWFGKGEVVHSLKQISVGDAVNDGAFHYYSFSLPTMSNNRPKAQFGITLFGVDSPDDCTYLDDVVVTGVRAGKRVTIYSENFEKAFVESKSTDTPGGWWKYSENGSSDNILWFAGTPKRGNHCVRLTGSLNRDMNDSNCLMERVISTVGYKNIQVSFYMGASGLERPTQEMAAHWMADGFWSVYPDWHELKTIKGDAAENDSVLRQYTFSLPAAAENNPKFSLWFGIRDNHPSFDVQATKQRGFVDDIVVTGEKM